MGCITLDLIRKRAEHHSASLFELEELSLAQQHLDRIDLLGRVCPNLKILTLQANSIVKLENLRRLKELRYLNLAMNRISRCENLQGCESLEKLDLTLNSIGIAELPSLASLQANLQLRRVYLLGNPCTAWPEHRQYVIAALPQVEHLDGTDVLRSERICAKRHVSDMNSYIRLHQDDSHLAASRLKDDSGADEVDMVATLAGTSCQLQPDVPASATQEVTPQTDEGRPRQKNQGRWPYQLEEGGGTCVLTLSVGKFMSMEHIDIDVHASYIHIILKGQIFCLHLPLEVNTTTIQAEHSAVTGVLTVHMNTVQRILMHAHSKQSDINSAKCMSSRYHAERTRAASDAQIESYEQMPDITQ